MAVQHPAIHVDKVDGRAVVIGVFADHAVQAAAALQDDDRRDETDRRAVLARHRLHQHQRGPLAVMLAARDDPIRRALCFHAQFGKRADGGQLRGRLVGTGDDGAAGVGKQHGGHALRLRGDAG
ncbi:hypothetical protein D3C71_1743150 [compost metagenome]